MSKSAVGQFSTSNVLLEGSQVQLSFPAATDKNGETVAYYAKIYWQPIYCSVSGVNYISIETTDTVRANMEIPLTVTGSTTLQSTIALNFDNKLSTDVRIYVVVIARDGVNGHPDGPPVLTSDYYYVIRHQIPTLALSSAEWTSGGIKEIRLNGNITDYGFTTPGNLSTLLASSSTWQAWRVGLETALGTIDLTFSFKVSYSFDNITFSEPDVYDITVTKELLNATSSTAAYTNDATFTLIFNKDETTPVPIDSILKGNSYFFKAYIISNYFTLSLDPDADSILLISNTPLFIMRDGIVQVNLPKNTTATTGAVMAARGPKQDATIGQSLALYDFHTRAGESEVANSPSIGFFDNLHNLMAKVGINYNISTDTGDIEITNLLTNGNIILTPNGTGVVKIGATPLILIPSLTGNSGKFLTTNGTTVSWASVDALPSQTGNSGKFLTTNGTVASWATVDVSGYVPLSGATYIQASGYSSTWGATNGISTGAFNAIMGVADGATWLLSGTSGGVFRGGIQLLDAGGTMRFYLGTNYYALTGNSGTIYHSGNFTPGDYLPLSGGTMTGTITNNIADGADRNILYGTIGTNDQYRIRVGGTNNAGWLEIATAGDGTEPIYIRQYTGVFGTVAGWVCIDTNHNFVSSHDFYTHSGVARCWDTNDFYFQTS